MPKSANQSLLDLSIRHAVELDRLQETEARHAVAFLDQHVLSDIRDRLETGLASIASGKQRVMGVQQLKSLQRLQTDLDELSTIGYSAMHDSVSARLNALARVEGRVTANQISQVMPQGVNVSIGLPSASTLNSIVHSRPFQGHVLKDWFGQLNASTRSVIQQQLNIGLTAGETTSQIVRRITSKSGVFGQARRNATSVVRTATNHVASQVREATYADNSDIIKGVQWVSTLDTRTSSICKSLDGRVFDLNEGPRPPAHFQCRSTTIPILDSYKRFGLKDPPASTRASLDGQVPDKMTYNDWLQTQPISIQNEALGPRRASLFRAGQLNVSDLVNNRGRPLTLAQIASRNGIPERTMSGIMDEVNPAGLTDEARKKVRSLDSKISRLKKEARNATGAQRDEILAKIKEAEEERARIKMGGGTIVTPPKPVTPPPVTPPPPPPPGPTPPPAIMDPETRKKRIASLASTKSRTQAQLKEIDAKLLTNPNDPKLLTKRGALQKKLDDVIAEYDALRRGGPNPVVPPKPPTPPKPVTPPPEPLPPPPEKPVTPPASGPDAIRIRREFEEEAAKIFGDPPSDPELRKLWYEVLDLDMEQARLGAFRNTGQLSTAQLNQLEAEFRTIIQKKNQLSIRLMSNYGRVPSFNPEDRAWLYKVYTEGRPVITTPTVHARSGAEVRKQFLAMQKNPPPLTPEQLRHNTTINNEIKYLAQEEQLGRISRLEFLQKERALKAQLAKGVDAKQMLHDLILEDKPIWTQLDFHNIGDRHALAKSNAIQAKDFLQRLITNPGAVQSHRAVNIKVYVSPKATRAYAYGDLGRIHMGVTTPAKTYVHEMSHVVEAKVPGWHKKVDAFYARRTAGDVPQSLRKLTGLNYEASEKTLKDRFIEVYMGKITGATNSEITSMAIEMLFDDPIRLMTQDPDMFDFIIDLAKGII